MGIGLAVWLAVRLSSPLPQHAGWAAAFAGACYLLAAWFEYLKSKGTDIMAKLRRKREEVPYYLRGEKYKKPRLSLFGTRHDFSDDMETASEGEYDAELPLSERRRLTMLAFLAVGAALLVFSQFIAF